MSAEHDKFGAFICGSRWFNGEPNIQTKALRPVRRRWLCPVDGCVGEMKFNGSSWPTGTPGYHHTCDVCKFTAAIRGVTYPMIAYVDEGVL